MMKRLIAVLAIAVMTLTFAVTAPDAQANTNCNPVPEPFATNPANGQVVAATKALADVGLGVSNPQATITALQAQGPLTPFGNAIVGWLQFKASGRCAGAVAGRGTIENMPAGPTGPLGFGSLNPVAAGAAAATAPASVAADTSPALAHTGSEAGALAFVGAGLVGFGALALGTRRRLL